MDDILGLVVVLIIYFVSAKAGKAKRQAKRAARQQRRSLRAAQAAFGGAPDRQTPEHSARAGEKAVSPRPDRPAAGPAREPSDAACEERPIHLHSVSQQAMREALEGEDPCHAGGAKAERDAAEFSPIYGGEAAHDREALAQDLLRGVIVSEILTRPSERAARNRRRA